ncbi:hypothetical protein D3C80_903820 [compost metagenome]
MLGVFGQIFPHEVLGKRKHRQHDVFVQLPARDVLNGVTDLVPNARNIQARVVSRQLLLQRSEAEFEVLPQHLDQRRVKARLIIVQHHGESGASTFTLQRDRNQYQWCFVFLSCPVLTRPAKETDSQEQRVRATFL